MPFWACLTRKVSPCVTWACLMPQKIREQRVPWLAKSARNAEIQPSFTKTDVIFVPPVATLDSAVKNWFGGARLSLLALSVPHDEHREFSVRQYGLRDAAEHQFFKSAASM